MDPFKLQDDPHFCSSSWHQALAQDPEDTDRRKTLTLSSHSLNHLLGCHSVCVCKTREGE